MPTAAKAASRKPAAKQVVPTKKSPVARKVSAKPVPKTAVAKAAAKSVAAKTPAKRVSRVTAPVKKAPVARKLFVLDTNILLHDPNSLLRFEEHDIYIPFVTIEEIDGKKTGVQDVNRNARQATRLLEEIVSQEGYSLGEGYPLETFNGGHAKGRLFLQDRHIGFLEGEIEKKNDNLYLAVLTYLRDANTHSEVVFVSKDLNIKLKARALGFKAEDFKHDHVIEDTDLIARGLRTVDEEEYESWLPTMESHAEGDRTIYEVPGEKLTFNEFLVLPDSRLYQVVEIDDVRGNKRATLSSIRNFASEKNAVMGISSRDDEQAAALALLTNPEIDLVALLGKAGSGKTLLTLAAALSMTIEESVYDDVLCTRAMIPVGEEIGFLPGTEEEKVSPWMGAMTDNLEVIIESAAEDPISQQKHRESFKEKISFRAMTFMRGRTFQRKFVIIDEAQNLTPKQVKTLVTRAGEGTKVVLMGNFEQIDSPWLSETSNGLTYAVENFRGWPHFGALVLEKGQRSRLASEANKRL